MTKILLPLILFFLAQLLAGAVALLCANGAQLFSPGAVGGLQLLPSAVAQGRALLVADISVVLVLWYFRLMRRRPYPIRTAYFRLGQWWSWVATCCLALGLSFLLAPLDVPDGGSDALFRAMQSDPLCLLALALAGPAVEECVFREGILRQLQLRGLAPWLSVGVSALLFAVIHGNWAQGVTAFVFGVLFGLLYLHSADLRVPLVAHIINNVLGILLLRLSAVSDALAGLPAAASLATGAALCLLAGVAWRRWMAVVPAASSIENTPA